LQNMRFGDRLQIHWQIADETWSQIQSPPLLLLPLIEYALNAMHDRLLCEQSTICISCALIDKSIQVCVRFSGVENNSPVAKFGLDTAQERLSLLFASAATLQLISDEISTNLKVSTLEPNLPNGLVLRFPVTLTHDE
jgi:LytS/YehU family sensor histidine kinase